MSKLVEQLLIVNLGGLFVFTVGIILALLWGRIVGGPVDRDEKLFIVKMFAAIWVFGNVLFFIMR